MNMKKIIITESQLNRLKNALNEESIQSSVVRQMKEFLDLNYAPVEKFMREGGEYYETPMIEIKADGEVISPKSLYEYLKYKYNMGEEFTKQVIRDWMYGNINDEHMLSKNVSLKEAKKDLFAEFAESRLKGATKITNSAKEKVGHQCLLIIILELSYRIIKKHQRVNLILRRPRKNLKKNCLHYAS